DDVDHEHRPHPRDGVCGRCDDACAPHLDSPPLGGARTHAAVDAADTHLTAGEVRLAKCATPDQEEVTRVRRIKIFDTTLRDGEQSPGIALRPDEKAEVAVALESLGVDVIEAGFAASSPGDFAGVCAVAEAVSAVTVASPARTTKDDIDACAEALRCPPPSRLHH